VIYPKPVHTWGAWEPKGPARRLTGYEVAVMVLGRARDVLAETAAMVDHAMTREKESTWGTKL